MALAQLTELERRRLDDRSATLGSELLTALRQLPTHIGSLELKVRGVGLMTGIELRRAGRPAGKEAVDAMKALLAEGFLVLPEGEHGEVLSLTPPLTIPRRDLLQAVGVIASVFERIAHTGAPGPKPRRRR
jgi:4-aminobutyrate aminotransferase-like enzyme